MPNERILQQKKETVKQIGETLKKSKSAVLVDYKGINVADDTKMRSELRKEGVQYAVVKNALLELACKEVGMNDFLPSLVGTTALAVSQDEIAPARILQKYAAKSKDVFNFKIGYIDGKYVSPDELQALALLPPRDGLIAQVAGSLNGIIAALARALSEVANKQTAA